MSSSGHSSDTEPFDSAQISYKSFLCGTSASGPISLISPRPYQQSLIDFAKSKNAIIYLDTGLGKTLIAVYVIKDLFHEPSSVNKIFTDSSPTTHTSSAKAFFVVKTRNLVKQQSKTIDKLTGLRVADSDVKYMSYARWRQELKRHDVFIIIDKILLELLRHGMMKIEEISLLIFDECHHTEGLSDYALIMKEFYFHNYHDSAKRPRILGLTASPIKTSHGKKFEESDVKLALQSLCNILNSTIAPFNTPEFETQISLLESKHEIKIVEFPGETQNPSTHYTVFAMKKIACAFLDYTKLEPVDKEKLKIEYAMFIEATVFSIGKGKAEPKAKYFRGDTCKIMGFLNVFIRKAAKIGKEIGLYGLYEYCLFCKNQMEQDYWLVKRSRLIEIIFNTAEKLIKPFIAPGKPVEDKYSNKMCKLLGFLSEHFAGKDPLPSCIIFVNERIIAHILYKSILSTARNFGGEKGVGLVMGHRLNFNVKRSELNDMILRQISTITMDPLEQLSAIELFRKKTHSLLIATDVVEEGMDIPSCNLVCCFDSIKNVKSFVQMQGRAREHSSQFVILSACEQTKLVKQRLNEFDELIKTSKKLALYAADGISPVPEAYKTFILPKDEYLEVPQTRAKICLHNARAFLSKYCQSLPADEFCKPFIEYTFEELKQPNSTQYIAIATLPPMVPKEIRYWRGKIPCQKKEAAEDLVAFEIIHKLKSMGKLNRYLLSTSKYGNDMFISDLTCDGLETIKGTVHKYIGTPILNEIQVFPIAKDRLEQCLYELLLDPMFPYLNQEFFLGALFFKEDLTVGNVDLILNNEKILEVMHSINECRDSVEKEKYMNIIGMHGSYYSQKIKHVQLTASLSKPRKLEISFEDYMKVKFFHYYVIYTVQSADFAFFRRVCSGKDDFSLALFKEDLVELKTLLKNDSEYILSKSSPSTEIISHMCFVPLKKCKEDPFPKIDLSLINEVLEHFKAQIKSGLIGKLVKAAPLTSKSIKGKLVTTFYNRGKYVVLDNSLQTLEAFMRWNDRKRRKTWKLKYWKYYKLRYGIELNIAGEMVLAKPAEAVLDKRIMHVDNCYQNFVFKNCRTEEERQQYLEKVASYYKKEKCKNFDLPAEVCEPEPLPFELYETIRTTPVILSSFNNITAFKGFKEEFFKEIYVDINGKDRLDVAEEKVPLSDLLKLHLLAEALTAGSANEGYNYQRLEFLGDSILRILEAWDAFAGIPGADIGELRVNKTMKLGNRRLSRIGYKLGFDKLLRVSPVKGAFAGYIPPGFVEAHEYLEIANPKKNIARNVVAFNRARSQKPFLDQALWYLPERKHDTPKPEDNSGVDDIDYVDKGSKRFKRILFEREDAKKKEAPNLEEAEGDPENFDAEAELKEIEEEEKRKAKSKLSISEKMVADTIESITAAVALSCGLHATQKWLKYIKLLKFSMEPVLALDPSVPKNFNFAVLEHKLKYAFKNPKLLLQAFTHASYFSTSTTDTFWEKDAKSACGSSESYQRLQYLGEGTGDYLVCKYLYYKYPHADPCLLHKLKICCLNNQLFCVIAVDLGLDSFLRSSSVKLSKELDNYKNCLKSLRNSMAGMDTPIDLDELDHCFVKVLSDLLEALIGVVMYETKDFSEVERVFLPIFLPYFEEYATPLTFKEHPKCFLYELVARQKGELRKIKWKKREKEDRKRFFVTNYRGWLGEILVAEEDFRYDNCITEKRFFKKMYENVKAIIDEYHKRKADGYGEYYLLLSTIIEDLGIDVGPTPTGKMLS